MDIFGFNRTFAESAAFSETASRFRVPALQVPFPSQLPLQAQLFKNDTSGGRLAEFSTDRPPDGNP
jgi:hypothetical protein